MGTLAPKAHATAPPTHNGCLLRLHYWREHLLEAKAGQSISVLTLTEVRGQLDHWLDVMLDVTPTLGPCALVEGETACRACGRDLSAPIDASAVS